MRSVTPRHLIDKGGLPGRLGPDDAHADRQPTLHDLMQRRPTADGIGSKRKRFSTHLLGQRPAFPDPYVRIWMDLPEPGDPEAERDTEVQNVTIVDQH